MTFIRIFLLEMLDDGGLVILLTIGLVILSIILRLFQSSDRTTTNATPSERVLTSERAIVVESHLLSKTQVFMHRYLPKRHNHRVVTVLANEVYNKKDYVAQFNVFRSLLS